MKCEIKEQIKAKKKRQEERKGRTMGKKEKGKKQAASNKEQRRDGRGREQRMQPGLRDWFQARTDLALEERERFPGDGGEVAGVVLKEKERSGGFRLTEVTILDEEGARQMGKPAGVYLTLEAPLFFGREEKRLRNSARIPRAFTLRKRYGSKGAAAGQWILTS